MIRNNELPSGSDKKIATEKERKKLRMKKGLKNLNYLITYKNLERSK